MLGIGASLEMLERLGTLAAVDGQVAVEGKALSVEPRSHDAEDDARGPHEGHYLEFLTLGDGHHIGTWVGNGRVLTTHNS